MPHGAKDHERLVRQLETIATLNDADRAALARLPLRLKTFEDNRDIVREGSQPADCCLILEGLAARYKVVVGGRRQIVSFHFPGDMPDLQSLELETMDYSLGALAHTRVAFVAHAAVRDIIKSHPGVASALLRHALVDASIFREWIANVGRRTAKERIAHVMRVFHPHAGGRSVRRPVILAATDAGRDRGRDRSFECPRQPLPTGTPAKGADRDPRTDAFDPRLGRAARSR